MVDSNTVCPIGANDCLLECNSCFGRPCCWFNVFLCPRGSVNGHLFLLHHLLMVSGDDVCLIVIAMPRIATFCNFFFPDRCAASLACSVCREFAFGADLTGLQTLNDSFHEPQFPLHTLSNWGWHAPHPASAGVKGPLFHADGSLNYVSENVSIASADTRPGKGNRTVPYQFNCANYNDPSLCNYLHTFPARVSLGQLKFVQQVPSDGCNSIASSSTAVEPLNVSKFAGLSQHLEMWTGTLHSNWTYEGHAVHVQTVVDSLTDTVRHHT